jgi:hypothetical protein
MIQKVKELSADQRQAIESLLGRPVQQDESISVRALSSGTAPEWMEQSWESARRLGVSELSTEEIDAEIHAARKARPGREHSVA